MKQPVTAVLVLLLLLGLGIGFLSGYGLGYRSCRLRPPPALPAPPPAASAPVAVPAPSPPRPAAVRPPQTLREALGQITVEVPEPRRGTGIIRGGVTLDNGMPVPGVKVLATPRRPDSTGRRHRPPRSANDEFELERNIRDLVEQRRAVAAIRREAVTGPDGRYVLDELEDSTWSLQASAGGYEVRAKDPSGSFNVRPDAQVDFLATVMVEVSCSMRLPDGKEPEQANIQGRSDSGRHCGAFWTPESRTIRLPPGRYELTASAGSRGEYRSEPQTADIVAQPGLALSFQLKGQPGVRGRVIFPRGIRPSHANIYAAPVKEGAIPDADTLMQSRRQSWASPYDGYNFTITDLEPGDYYVAVVDTQARRVLGGATVRVPAEMVQQDITVPMPDRAAYLLVWAYGPDGQPLADLTLSTRSSAGGTARAGLFQSGRNPDGSWWVLHPDEAPEADARHWVTVNSARHGTRTVEYLRVPRAQATVRFEGAAALTVRVAGVSPPPSGAPLVVGVREAGQDKDNATRPVQADGTALFDKLTAGRQTLTLYSQIHRARQWAIQSVTVSLAAGDNQTTIVAPPLYSLTVTVADPAWGRNVHFMPAVPREGWPTAYANLDDATRSITFNGLPAGQYVFKMVHGEKTGRMTLAVPDQVMVFFDSAPLNAIEVFVKKADGYLAKAGFETGDVITAINGVPFKQINTVGEIFGAYTGLREVTLTILRKGQELHLKVDAGKLQVDSGDGSFNSTCVNAK